MNSDTIVSKLNDLFLDIPNIQNQTSQFASRKRNVSMIDVFNFLFKYSQKYKTKQSLISDFNFDSDITITQSAMYSKEKHISINCCKQICQRLYSILNDLYVLNPLMKNIEKKLTVHIYLLMD